MATINDLTKQLATNNANNMGGHQATSQKLDTLNKSFNSFFNYMKKGDLDRLEASREGKGKAASVKPGQGKTGGSSGFPLGLALPLGLNIPSLVAGIAAIAGAFAGLRGWEARALKNIDKLGDALRALIPKQFREDLVKSLNQKFVDLRAQILRVFGLDDTLKRFNDPESGLKKPIGEQLMERFSKFRTRILNAFGIGADGKPIVVQGEDGKFKVPTIGKITMAIEDLFRPIGAFIKGVGNVLKAGALPFLVLLKSVGVSGLGAGGKIIGMVAGVGKLFAKILWPLGVIFAMIDGVKAYQDKEGSTYEKILAGAFGFIGDFIGAPLDLLKGAVSWLLRNALGVEVDEDGNVKPGQGLAGKFIDIINKFSFEEAIKAIPELFEKVFGAITAFFDDPIGIGKQVVGKLLDAIREAVMGVVRGIVGVLPEFLQKKVLGEEEFAKFKAQTEMAEAKAGLAESMRALEEGVFKRAELRSLQRRLKDVRPGTSEYVDINRQIAALGGGRNEMQMSSALERERQAVIEAEKRFDAATRQLAQVIDGSTNVSSAPQAFAMGPTSAFDTTDHMMMEAYGAR